MMEDPGLARLLLDLQDAFEWLIRADDYSLAAAWERERSGSTFLRMVGVPGGPEVIVKTVVGWAPEDAERMFRSMEDLAATIDAAEISGGAAIRPLAWSGTPPLLVMPYVEGTDLVSMLRQPDHPAWTAEVPAWMGQAGAMLAAFHARHLTPPREDISTAGEEARALARRFRIDDAALERILNQVDWRHRCARSFGDFGPGNLLGAQDGRLYLLDPPDQPPTALIHRDLANFVFELRRQLAGRGFTRSRPVTGHFEQLRSAFMGGYSAAWHEEPLGPGDETLIALFEMRRAAGMARKRFPGRPGDAVWFGRSALALRREVLRSAVRGRTEESP
jgi:hypothetical protein